MEIITTMRNHPDFLRFGHIEPGEYNLDRTIVVTVSNLNMDTLSIMYELPTIEELDEKFKRLY